MRCQLQLEIINKLILMSDKGKHRVRRKVIYRSRCLDYSVISKMSLIFFCSSAVFSKKCFIGVYNNGEVLFSFAGSESCSLNERIFSNTRSCFVISASR